MKYKKFYTGKYDVVFKMVLCSEESKHLLQEFLSRILNKKVEVIKYLRNELPISNVNNKLRNVDLLVKADDEYIHIELNNGIGKYLHVRNYGYFTTIYNSHVRRGEAYDVDTKFIHFDFTYGIKDDKDYRVYTLQDRDRKRYVENFEIIEYNMDKLMKYWYDEDRENINKYKHLIMLDLKDKELEKIAKGDRFMEEYEDKLNKLNEEEEFQSWMTYEEDQKFILNTEKKIAFEDGEIKGKLEGRYEGRNEGIRQTAKAFKDNGVSIDVIIKSTGLTRQEINRL